MKDNKTILQIKGKLEKSDVESINLDELWAIKIRNEFLKKLWEKSPRKLEPSRLYFKPNSDYYISFEDQRSVSLYKILFEKTVFGHYRAFKKELTKKEFIRLSRIIEEDYQNNNKSYKTKAKAQNKKNKKEYLQYYLFDLAPYTLTKTKNEYEIGMRAKKTLSQLAKEIYLCKKEIENEDNYHFIKSFSYVSYTPDRISSYIVFDDNGRPKKKSLKYWEFLKSELSKLAQVPINKIVI